MNKGFVSKKALLTTFLSLMIMVLPGYAAGCVKLTSGLCVSPIDVPFKPISSSSPEYKAMKAKGLFLYDSGATDDYWAGALYKCTQLGMRLPKLALPVNNVVCPANGGGELCEIYRNKTKLNMMPVGYWSVHEYSKSDLGYSWYVNMGTGKQMRYDKTYNGFNVRCVK